MSDPKTDISNLVANAKALNAKAANVRQAKASVLAELEARRRALRKAMEAAEKAGYDPDNMKAELSRKIEVEKVKQETMASELATSEAILRPMLEEIRRS